MAKLTKDSGFDLLYKNIQFNLTHADYKRTLEIADFCKKMVTGEGQREFIVRYVEQKNKKKKEAIVKLTNTLTPLALNPPRKILKRSFGVSNISYEIEHEDGDQKKKVLKELEQYYNGKALLAYLREMGLRDNFEDPNRFRFTERYDYRNKETIERTALYPFEISSKEAVNYEYHQGILQWLIIEHERTEEVIGIDKDGYPEIKTSEKVNDYYLYAPGFVYKFTEYKNTEPPEYKDKKPTEKIKRIDIPTVESRTRTFTVEVQTNGTTEMPGGKLGILLDIKAKGEEIYVPFYWPVRHVLIDMIGHKSRLDVVLDTKVFPRIYQYVPICNYSDKEGNHCDRGKIYGVQIKRNDEWVSQDMECPKCRGRGRLSQVTEQDEFTMILPTDKDEFMPDLSKLIYTEKSDIETARFLHDLVKHDIDLVMIGLFNTESVEKPKITRTATEIGTNHEEMNDTVREFTSMLSRQMELHTRIGFQYHGYGSPKVNHAHPDDLKLQSLSELIVIYQNLVTAGAPYEAKRATMWNILNKSYKNDPVMLNNIKAKESFRPFRSMSDASIALTLQGRDKTDPDKVAHENFDAIMNLVDWSLQKMKKQNGSQGKQNEILEFSQLSQEKQTEAFKKALDEKLATIIYTSAPELPDPFAIEIPEEVDIDE